MPLINFVTEDDTSITSAADNIFGFCDGGQFTAVMVLITPFSVIVKADGSGDCWTPFESKAKNFAFIVGKPEASILNAVRFCAETDAAPAKENRIEMTMRFIAQSKKGNEML
jgi:hypothetical protein